MVSRYRELPSTVRVQCPNCGVFAYISLKYTEGDTGDYEVVCDAELEGGGLCGASLLLTIHRHRHSKPCRRGEKLVWR